jgi:transcriptional regulator with XRE-family HTH domain
MAIETHPPSGVRLLKLRKAAGLTRKDIEIRHGIKSISLRGWETGLRTLQQHKAETLASVFQSYGINCTADWILHGKGIDPLEPAYQATDEANTFQEIAKFKSFYKNSIVIRAPDNCMEPWIKKDDYVGGVFVDPASEIFVDHVCIIQTREFGTQIRLVQKTQNRKLYNLISFSHQGELLDIEMEAVATILLLRKPLISEE